MKFEMRSIVFFKLVINKILQLG